MEPLFVTKLELARQSRKCYDGKHTPTPITLIRLRTGDIQFIKRSQMTQSRKDKTTKTPVAERKEWQLIFKGQIEDFDSSDSLTHWQSKTDLEKFQAVAELIHEAQVIKARLNYDEPSLLRSTAVLKRI